MYRYDDFGWYVGITDKLNRSTGIAPSNLTLSAEPGDMRANWTGYEWVDLPYEYRGNSDDRKSTKLSPVELKLLFTTQERLAIKDARELDPIIQDAFELLDDVRLTEVDMGSDMIIGICDYLVTKSLITAERKNEILGIV